MKRLILTGALLALAPGAALAQAGSDDVFIGPVEGTREVTLSGSGSSDNEFDTNSIGASGSYGWYANQNLLLGLRQSVSYADTGNDDALAGSTRGFIDYVFDAGRLRPYVGANLGFVYGENVADTAAAGPEIGIKYYADDKTFLFGQAEYQVVFDDVGKFDDAFNDGIFNYTIGVGFNF